MEQSSPPKQEASLLWPLLFTLLVSALVFGSGGYYLGAMSKQTQSPGIQNEKTQQDNLAPSSQSSVYPSTQPTTKKIVEFFDLPQTWVSTLNGTRTNKDCYQVVGQKIGEINQPFKDYFAKEYNGDNLDTIISSTKQYVWQGIESYTLPSLGIGEINTVYVRPGEDQWYKINVDYIGPGEGTTSPPGSSCTQEEKEIETILRNIRFL